MKVIAFILYRRKLFRFLRILKHAALSTGSPPLSGTISTTDPYYNFHFTAFKKKIYKMFARRIAKDLFT